MYRTWTKKTGNIFLLFQIVLFFGLPGCGDKGNVSQSQQENTILAVRVLEANNGQVQDEQLQVALLNANGIQSEESARQAVEEASWVPIDNFNSQNLVFKEVSQQELAQADYDSDYDSNFDFAGSSVIISGNYYSTDRDSRRHRGGHHNRDYHHNRGDYRYRDGDHRHNRGDYRHHNMGYHYPVQRHCSKRKNCWIPYRHHYRWIRDNRAIYWGCRRCSSRYLYRRGRCVIPFTPVYGYYWYPRHQYFHNHHRYPNSYSSIRIVLYW